MFGIVLVLSPQDGARARTRCSEKQIYAFRTTFIEHEHEHRFAEHEYENCASATGICLIPLKPARLETLLRRDKGRRNLQRRPKTAKRVENPQPLESRVHAVYRWARQRTAFRLRPFDLLDKLRAGSSGATP